MEGGPARAIERLKREQREGGLARLSVQKVNNKINGEITGGNLLHDKMKSRTRREGLKEI